MESCCKGLRWSACRLEMPLRAEAAGNGTEVLEILNGPQTQMTQKLHNDENYDNIYTQFAFPCQSGCHNL